MHRLKMFCSLSLLSLSVWAQTATSPPTAPTKSTIPQFEDVAKQSGLVVAHISSPEKHYIIESVSGGVGLFDCDNDGKLDIVVVNGSTVERFKQSGGDPLVTLWHQEANL